MKYCCVKHCKSNSNEVGVSFYRFPKVNERFVNLEYKELIQKRREAWFQAVRMRKYSASIDNLENYRICSKHFKSGTPSDFRKIYDEDWLPSVNVNVIPTSSPKSTTNAHGIRMKSIWKKRKLFVENDEDLGMVIEQHVVRCLVDASTQTDMSGEDIICLMNSRFA